MSTISPRHSRNVLGGKSIDFTNEMNKKVDFEDPSSSAYSEHNAFVVFGDNKIETLEEFRHSLLLNIRGIT